VSSNHLATPFVPARPVADAPVQELAGRAEELARRWAFALLAAHPLQEMSAVPLEELARHAPALCASLARALVSEQELRSFAGGEPAPGALALSALAAAWEAREAVEHVEALRRVLWEAALETLANPSAREVADLADRLGSVCAALLSSALAEHGAGAGEQEPPRASRPPRERVLYRAPGQSPEHSGAVLIDERDEVSPRPAPPASPPLREPPAPSLQAEFPSRTAPRPLPWDIPLRGSVRAATAPPPQKRDPSEEVLRVSRGPFRPGEGPLD